VEAISNAIAAVKSAPLRKSERARATEAYEQLDEAAPRPLATSSVRGESSGRRRRISRFETTACTTPERAKPRMSAQRISQVMPAVKERARTISCPIATVAINRYLVLGRERSDGWSGRRISSIPRRAKLRDLLEALALRCR